MELPMEDACQMEVSPGLEGKRLAKSLGDLHEDCLLLILQALPSFADLARAECVCKSWRMIVMNWGLWRHTCTRTFPHMNAVTSIESMSGVLLTQQQQSSAYRLLYKELSRTPCARSIISAAVSASSTDHGEENIQNTVLSRALKRAAAAREHHPCYWSSKGSENPNGAEWLLYQLAAPLTVVHEIRLQPFLADFQPGDPVYSARAVRFRLGYCPEFVNTSVEERMRDATKGRRKVPPEGEWTYTSPIYPMTQEFVLQRFRLPEPVLCVGGALLVELLGHTERQEIDSLYYICVFHIHVVGRPARSFSCKQSPQGWQLLCPDQLSEPNNSDTDDSLISYELPSYAGSSDDDEDGDDQEHAHALQYILPQIVNGTMFIHY